MYIGLRTAFWLGLAVFLATFIALDVAYGAQDQPRLDNYSIMRFDKVVHFEGDINSDVADAIIASYEAEPFDMLILHSQGGYVGSALRLGFFLAQKDITTKVNAKKICSSACVTLLISGKYRIVNVRASIGVHRPTGTRRMRKRARQERKFLTDMTGVDPAYMKMMASTPNHRMYWFSPGQLQKYRLATELLH